MSNAVHSLSDARPWVRMRRGPGGSVEIVRLESVAAVLTGDEAGAVFDVYSSPSLTPAGRQAYAEGVLHGRDMALKAARIETAYLRDPEDAADGGQVLCITIGGEFKTLPLTPWRLAKWARLASAAIEQALRTPHPEAIDADPRAKTD